MVPGRPAFAALLALNVVFVSLHAVRGTQIKNVAPLPIRIAVISRQKTITFRDTITLRGEETLLILAELAPAVAKDIARVVLHFWRGVGALFGRSILTGEFGPVRYTVVNVLRALVHPERRPGRLLRRPHVIRMADLLLVSATFLVVTLVELAEVEASRGHVKAAIRRTDLLILAILTIHRAHATTAATPGPRRLRIDLLMNPATRIRLWATRRSVTLRV